MPTINNDAFAFRSCTRYTSGLPPVNVYNQNSQVSAFNKFWVHTPNYRQLKASRQVLPDNTFTWRLRYGGGGNAGYFDGLWSWVYSAGHWWFPPDPLSNILDQAEYTALEQRAISKIIDKAKGQQWNAPVFVAEAGKTAAMVTQRARHLVSMAQALRQGNIVRFFKLFHPTSPPPPRKGVEKFKKRFGSDPRGAAANAWLEYTYGWTPFMLDVRNGVNTLMDSVDRPDHRVGRVVGFARGSYDKYGPEEVGYQQPPFMVGYVRRRMTGTASYRYVWYFKPTALDTPSRFGMLNPLEVVWELIPFSFVADWFLPIGDYLGALDMPWRFTHHGGTRGFRQDLTWNTFPTREEGWSYVYGGYGDSFTVGVIRTALAGIPQPTLSSLAFSPNLSLSRMVSSISLLRQQMLRLDHPNKGNYHRIRF